MTTLTKEDIEAINRIREKGHAVVVFDTRELKDMPSEAMEEFLGEEGTAFLKSCEPDDESTKKRWLSAYEQACRDAGVPPLGPIRG
jgi:hypothetical protein